jgi:hypothetical protein
VRKREREPRAESDTELQSEREAVRAERRSLPFLAFFLKELAQQLGDRHGDPTGMALGDES